jgi:hypothetical protein
MSRRVTLPGADELFRATGQGHEPVAAVDLVAPPAHEPADGSTQAPQPAPSGNGGAAANGSAVRTRSRSGVRQTPRPRPRADDDRRPSGRERHDEKITVYLSPDELVDLERARLALRQDHGLAVDRGRIVREALAVVLADLEHRGDGSTLVRQLRDG